jgi:hypothetical protein
MNQKLSNNRTPTSITTDYLDRLHNSAGSNRDTDGLGAMAVGSFIIGSVDAINGEGGKEAPEFVATSHEIKQLAKYWLMERIEDDFHCFLYQSSGSSEWRWSSYINRRLNRLSEILEPEAMRKLYEDAVASFRKGCPTITNEDWRVFTEGSPEEQDAWRTNTLNL